MGLCKLINASVPAKQLTIFSVGTSVRTYVPRSGVRITPPTLVDGFCSYSHSELNMTCR